MDNNSNNDKKDSNSKDVQIAKNYNFSFCQSTIAGLFRKSLCKLPENSIMLNLFNIFYV